MKAPGATPRRGGPAARSETLYTPGECPYLRSPPADPGTVETLLTPVWVNYLWGLRELRTYHMPLDLVRERSPERPVALVRPDAVAVAGRWFQDNFKGDVLYAVKA